MKGMLVLVNLAFFLAAPAFLQAQSDAGTWKLNTARSKYSGIATPKSRLEKIPSVTVLSSSSVNP